MGSIVLFVTALCDLSRRRFFVLCGCTSSHHYPATELYSVLLRLCDIVLSCIHDNLFSPAWHWTLLVYQDLIISLLLVEKHIMSLPDDGGFFLTLCSQTTLRSNFLCHSECGER